MKKQLTTFVKVGKKFLSYKISSLEERKDMMVKYMKLKMQEEDWHGVADAAMDIRDIESELLAYRSIKNE